MDRASNRHIYKKHFTLFPLLKNLVDTFETMNPYLSVDLVWLLCKSKEGDGFQGWHKDFLSGQRITKTIVINVGSKERDNEETTRSFDSDESFKVDKPAAIPTNNPSVTPSAIPHLKPSVKPVAIPHENSGTIPPLHGKNDDYFAEDDRKSAAN